jgi:hypothetical protein
MCTFGDIIVHMTCNFSPTFITEKKNKTGYDETILYVSLFQLLN